MHLQVTAALAVAEAAYEFEHRDLHWFTYHPNLFACSARFFPLTADWAISICYRGNILLNRNDSYTLKFILDGKQMSIRTFGLSISLIDFTLSRIKAGEIFLCFSLYFCYIRD